LPVNPAADFRLRPLKSGSLRSSLLRREGASTAVATPQAGADPNEAIHPQQRQPGVAKPPVATQRPPPSSAVEHGHLGTAMVLVNAGATLTINAPVLTPLHTLTWPQTRTAVTTRRPTAAGNHRQSDQSRLSAGKSSLMGRHQRRPVRTATRAGGRLAMAVHPVSPRCRTDDIPRMKLYIKLGANPLLSQPWGSTPSWPPQSSESRPPTRNRHLRRKRSPSVESLAHSRCRCKYRGPQW